MEFACVVYLGLLGVAIYPGSLPTLGEQIKHLCVVSVGGRRIFVSGNFGLSGIGAC